MKWLPPAVTALPAVLTIEARLDGSSSMRVERPIELPRGYLLQKPSPGRPRNFDNATEERLREKFRGECLRHKKHYGALPRHKDAKELVLQFAKEENIRSSWIILRRRVVVPVLQELRRQK